MIGTPQTTSAQANGGASRSPRSETAPSAPTRPPAPIAAVRYPTSVAPLCEYLVREHDDQHVQAPAHERLRGDEAHEQPRARDFADRLEALPDLDSRPVPGEGTRPGTDTRASRAAETSRARGAGREDRSDVGERDQYAGAERPEQGAEALDRRGRSVRGDQLARRARE